MTVGSIGTRLRALVRGERGMALPTALFAMVASLGLAGVAVMSTVDVQHGSQRDSGSKSAIAAADAGANVAMMRLNRNPQELETASCLEGKTPESNGWCPPVGGEVGGSTYKYQVSKAGTACGEFDLCVVVTGTAGEVSRRVLISFDQGPSASGDGSGGEGGTVTKEGVNSPSNGHVDGLTGKDGLTFSGNADIRVNVGTDGSVVSSGNTSICGNIRHGVGKTWSHSGNASQCSGYKVSEENVTLPPVSSFMPSDIATRNSNGRITMCSKGLPAECQKDTYVGGKWSSTSPLNPTTRRISLSGNTTLSLGGGDYWLCELSLSGNSELIMAASSHVRLFFDTPEHCGTTTPINLSGNNKIVATGYSAATKTFDMPGFYLLGSTTTASTVNLSGNFGTTDEFVVYGPNTNVNISGNATFKGVVAGKTVTMSGNGKFEQDAGFLLEPKLNPWYVEEVQGGSSDDGGGTNGAASVYTPQFYVECTGVATTTPSANC
jgi:hypothetical protein